MVVQINENMRDIFLKGVNKLADEVVPLPETLKIVSKESGSFDGNAWAKLSAVDSEGTPYEVKISGYDNSLNLSKLMFKDIETKQILKSLATKTGKKGSAYIAGFDFRVTNDYLKTLLK